MGVCCWHQLPRVLSRPVARQHTRKLMSTTQTLKGEGSSNRNACRDECVECGDDSVEGRDESVEAGEKHRDHVMIPLPALIAGGRLNIKMSSYQYSNPRVKDKTVLQPLYL